MRKQWIALALCVCLCLSAAAATADVAVKETTQLDKLKGHWMNSSFQSTLKATVSEQKPDFLSIEEWALIRAWAQGYTLSFTHTNQDSTANLGSEDVLTLEDASGAAVIQTILAQDANGIRYVRSPLLDDQNIYYAFDSSYDFVSLLTEATRDTAWPSLWHVLYAVAAAPADWQTRAQPVYSQYAIKLTGWLQNYARTVTETQTDGSFVMTNDYEIPASDLKQETKAILVDLLMDQDLLSLLREILTVDEQAAYLEKDMLLSFLSMIDRVQLNGSVQIHRQFHDDRVSYESVTLPFAQNAPLKELTVVHSAQEDGELWQLRADITKAPYSGASVELTAQKMDAGIWVGELTWQGPADSQTAVRPEPLTFAYNLEWNGATDVNDPYAAKYERNYKGTLVVKPDASLRLPVMSLALDGKIYSKTSSQTAPTYVDVTLEWADLESGASALLSFSGKTNPRRTPIYLSDAIASALRLDMLSADNRAMLLKNLLNNIPARFAQLMTASAQ